MLLNASHRNALQASQQQHQHQQQQQPQQQTPTQNSRTSRISLETDYDLCGPFERKSDKLTGPEAKLAPAAKQQLLENPRAASLQSRRTLLRGRRSKRPVRRGTSRPSGTGMSLPPPMSTTPTVDHTFRFRCKTTGSYTVTGKTLALALGSVCTITNSTIQALMSSFRVRRVTIWPPALNSSTDDADLYWYGPIPATQKDNAKIRTLPDGITVTGAAVYKPPRGTHCGDWLQTNLVIASNLFGVTLSQGAILDLHAVSTLANTFGADSATDTIASGIIGNVYYMPLDGNTSAKLEPVGITTTA